MSISKLESLPNEILIDLLEKYVNGVDVFAAFRNHLNSLFDALVEQCRQFHFDFESIRKNDFQLCISLLLNYRGRIQSLTLSERGTPGQIYAFLSVFPTFDQFKQLRQLRLNFNGNTVEYTSMIKAIRSLWKTNIHRLSIEGKNTLVLFWLNHIIQGIFTLASVRRLFLAIDMNAYRWDFQRLIPFHIEHLTIKGCGCTWNTLKIIFKYASCLSYLNVRVVHNSPYSHQCITDKPFDIQPLTKLNTLILDFIDNYDLITLDMLVFYLRMMPHLHHLEIIDTHARFLDGNAWQMCIQTTLLFLTWFSLTIDCCFLQENHLHHALSFFQTQFWIERKTFNVYVITFEDVILFNSRHNSKDHSKSKRRPHSFLTIVPQRCEKDSRLLLKNLTTLHLSGKSSIVPIQYYFSTVKHLTVNHLNSSLFRWITMNINLLNLTELWIPYMETMTDEIDTLLTHAKNISSLMVHFNQLFGKHSVPMNVYNSIRRLDISVAQHPFRQDDIILLTRLFPSIEHLKINMISLDNIPLLNTYLPNLHSFTFKFVDPRLGKVEYVLEEQWNYRLQIQSKLLFNRTNEWITIWIDQVTFQKPYWQSFLTNLHQLYHGRLSKSYGSKRVSS